MTTRTSIDSLVASIAESYRAHPTISNIDSGKLPNKDAIIKILEQLREIMYPGYFGKQDLRNSSVEYEIGSALVSIEEKLGEQIEKALRYTKRVDHGIEPDIKAQTVKTLERFMLTIPDIREVLDTDVEAAFNGDPAAFNRDEIIFSYPGIFAITVNRIAHELYKLSVPLIPRIMTEYAHSITGIDIHPGATIGKYFFIDHGTGVVIGETTFIGNNVKIYQGVTLGAISTRGGQALRSTKRHPTLEDNVTVYSGASILGGETVIGKGVVIGSNVFITKSVPDRTRVSVKNPELQFKDHTPSEFIQESFFDWVI